MSVGDEMSILQPDLILLAVAGATDKHLLLSFGVQGEHPASVWGSKAAGTVHYPSHRSP